MAITRNTGKIVDDRVTLTKDAVEESGFADVGTPNEGNKPMGHGDWAVRMDVYIQRTKIASHYQGSGAAAFQDLGAAASVWMVARALLRFSKPEDLEMYALAPAEVAKVISS